MSLLTSAKLNSTLYFCAEGATHLVEVGKVTGFTDVEILPDQTAISPVWPKFDCEYRLKFSIDPEKFSRDVLNRNPLLFAKPDRTSWRGPKFKRRKFKGYKRSRS